MSQGPEAKPSLEHQAAVASEAKNTIRSLLDNPTNLPFKLEPFLRPIEAFGQTGLIGNPDAQQEVEDFRNLAGDRRIWRGVVQEMREADGTGNRDQARRMLNIAQILGMDEKGQDPRIAEYMGALYKKFPEKAQRRVSRKGFLQLSVLAGAAAFSSAFLGKNYITANNSPNIKATLIDKPPVPAPSVSPANLPTAEAIRPPEKITSLNEFMKIFIDLSHKKRLERSKDPNDESFGSVDIELNTDLINFVLSPFSQGQGESLTVLSYNIKTGKITSVSLTREAIIPEIIRYNSQNNPAEQKKKGIYSMESAGNMMLNHTGGFDLTRKVVENATGLVADFEIYMDEMFLHDFIKDLLGNKIGIEVKSNLFLRDQTWSQFGYDEKGFSVSQGKHLMTADEAMRYILASDDKFTPGKGNSSPGRKNDLIVACFSAASKAFKQDPARFISSFLAPFLPLQMAKQRISSDAGVQIIAIFADIGPKISSYAFGLPEVTENDVMINDADFGDGGLTRVHKIITEDGEPTENYSKLHPNMRKLIDDTRKMIVNLKAQGITIDDQVLSRKGVIPRWAQIPLNGDPEAKNLATDYWGSARKLVKERLGNQT